MLKLNKQLILASNSPRRKEIMTSAGFSFTVKVKETNEDFSDKMPVEEVPMYLAEKKAMAFANDLKDEIILCADTVVIIDGLILNKPSNHEEAKWMLKLLSGKTHQVITGVCILTKESKSVFSDLALVTFKELTEQEIDYYIKTCKPFDKAGAYGVQDFIGMVGIVNIVGSYYTIMGLPIHKVYEKFVELKFIEI